MRRTRRIAVAIASFAVVGTLAGCIEIHSMECTLDHVPEGQLGQLGRPMSVSWRNAPVAFVEFNMFTHRQGDGDTAYIDVGEDYFLVVTLQDVMRLEGVPERPHRWTSAIHFELRREVDGRRRIYQWHHYIGRADSAEAREAREGRYLPEPDEPGEAQEWLCGTG